MKGNTKKGEGPVTFFWMDAQAIISIIFINSKLKNITFIPGFHSKIEELRKSHRESYT